jgi:ubiquinone/menaquinone biosynthesis C-methylase UbiE
MTNGKHAIRQAYNDIAGEYLAKRSAELSATVLPDELSERLPDGGRVLDAGCGAGVPVAKRLAETFCVVGVDFSIEQVRRARRNVPQAAFVQGDMTALAFADDSFDVVCAFFSLIHVPMDEHRRVTAEFHRVLRPGGMAALTVGADEWTGSNPDWLDTGVEMHWSFPDTETSVRYCREAGFDVLQRHSAADELGGPFPFLLVKKAEAR